MSAFEAAQTAIAAILQSPSFLYRLEFDAPQRAAGDVVPVTGYEMASRLSFFIWSSVPDEAVLEAARRGHLDTPEGVLNMAEAMLEDPRARRIVKRFYAQWLDLKDLPHQTKDAHLYPQWSPQLAHSMLDETLGLVEHLTFEADGTVDALFTTNLAFIDAPLGELYDVEVPDDGSLHAVELPRDNETGILARGAFLAQHAKHNQSSPILRGVFVREKVLCQPLAPPPQDVNDEPPPLDDDATTQERFAAHTQNPSCAGCHTLIDPVGFGFENFDATGAYRFRENGLAIDTEVNLVGTETLNGRYANGVELSHALGDSDEVRRCVSSQWLRFAIGRSPEDADACGVNAMMAVLAADGFTLRQIILAVTQTDGFLYRTATE